ncbi:MAG: hypothetical protein J2P21_01735 [Chloracidobacterium sp.]|nr:hypothetical protein [Chloracidobacterium sp.]
MTALLVFHVSGRVNRVGERLPTSEFAGKAFDYAPRARQGMPDAIDKFIERKIALSRQFLKLCRDRQ